MSGVFEGRRYAVLGLGRNGLPAARRLAEMGARVVCWDDGQAGRDAAASLGLPVAERPDMSGFDALVLSPGIAHHGPRAHPVAIDAIARGVPVLSDAQLLFEAVRKSGLRAHFVGITGTNGKSTTTALLAHLLASAGIETAAGGNLGPAALSLPLLGDDGVYVLEMSSYMLERVPALHFDAAALLNLSPDHLDRHGSMADYVAAKRLIFANRTARDVAVVGIDDDQSRAVAWSLSPRPVTISGSEGDAEWHVTAGTLVHSGQAIADLTPCAALRGQHNHQNAAAASCLAAFLGVPSAAIAAGLASFGGLAHRQKRIATVDGIAFVDDSKATNAEAASRALGCTPPCIWIAGGLAKDGGIETLGPSIKSVAAALLIGRDAELFARALGSFGIEHRIAGTLNEAVPMALEAARRHGVGTVLLSPAAASFDQFTDFEERGRRFAQLVASLEGARSDG